jgi:large subunit ribosomal protein L24
MKIKTGDKVQVTAGKDKGKTGKVLQVFPTEQRVSVEGVNILVKHLRGSGKQAGQKVEFPAPIHISNLMLIDPKTNTPTRVGYKVLDQKDGKEKKVRIAKRTGEVIS